MRLALILAAAGLALSACAPETAETPAGPEAAPAPSAPPAEETPPATPEPEASPEPDATPEPDAIPAPDAAQRAYFEAAFSGSWGEDAACAEEGLFRLSPDQLSLYDRRCEVLTLIRDGDMIAARTQCTEEGQPMAENTHMLTPVSEDTITVSDGHYEWTRTRCGDAGE